MENKESKIFGIPFALVFFIIALVVLIDGFIWFFVFYPLRAQVSQVGQEVRMVKVTPTPTMIVPTATPSATVTPEIRVLAPQKEIVPSNSVK